MPPVFNYKFDNFVEIPTAESKTIKIYDKYGKLRYELDPNVCYFYSKNNAVVISVEDEKEIILDFIDQNEALRAITKLNSIKITVTSLYSETDVYTRNQLDNGALDFRYYTQSQTYNTGQTYSKAQVDTLVSATTFDSRYYYNSGQTYTKIEVNNLILSSSAYTLYMYSQATGYTDIQTLTYYNLSTGYTNQQVLKYYNLSTGYTNTQLLNYYTKSQADALFVTGDTFDNTLYYTKLDLQSSGITKNDYVHWLNISNNPFTAQEYTYPPSSGPFAFDSFPSGNSFSVSWTYAIKCNTVGQTGVKIAQIYACWDNVSGTVEFGEIGSKSVGNTDDFDLRYEVISAGGQIYFRTITPFTYSWTVRFIRNML